MSLLSEDRIQGTGESFINVGGKSQKNKTKILNILGGVLILLGVTGIIFGSIKLFTKNQENGNHQQFVYTIDQNTNFVKNESGCYINDVKSDQIKYLSVRDSSKVDVFTSADFPSLLSINFADENLFQLNLQEQLNIKSLSIYSSSMTFFEYNNSHLQNIILRQNSEMQYFVYSNLPSLKTLVLVNNYIQIWANNTFGKLDLFKISQSYETQKCILPPIEAQHFVVEYSFFDKFYVTNVTKVFNIEFNNLIINQFIIMTILKTFSSTNSTINDYVFTECTNLTTLQIFKQQSLYSLIVQFSPVLSQLKIDNNNIEQLELFNTNVRSLEDVNTSFLKTLRMVNTPLNSLPIKLINSPTLTALQLDYQNIKQHNFNFNLQKIEYLGLNHYHGHLSLTQSQYPRLTYLKLISCNIPSYNFNEIKLSSFYFDDVNIQIKYISDILKNKTIQEVVIYGNTTIQYIDGQMLQFDVQYSSIEIYNNPIIKRVSNSNFSGLQYLTFDNCSLLQKITNSTLNQLYYFTISNNNQLQNYLRHLIILNNSKLIQNQKYFQYNRSVSVRLNMHSMNELSKFLNNNYYIEWLTLENYQNFNFSSLTKQNIAVLKIVQSKNCNFTNMTLKRVDTLELEGVVIFSDNSLPYLTSLTVQKCFSLDMQIFITALRNYSYPNLRYIYLPPHTTKEQYAEIVDLYTNAIIYVRQINQTQKTMIDY